MLSGVRWSIERSEEATHLTHQGEAEFSRVWAYTPNPGKYTRPITFDELFKAAYVLSMGIARLADEMMSTTNGANEAQSWSELRNSSEALAAIADHVCNDARYWDDDEDDTPANRVQKAHS